MSLILCPECGTKISDKATECPHCGYQSVDSSRPISEQDKYEIAPIFEYDIEEWKPNRGNLSIIFYEDNKSLIEYFGDWETIKVKLPALAEVIGSLANKEHVMIAKMDSYVKDLIDKSVYRFTIDKNGEILPTIRDADGFVKQVRLEDMALTPNLTQSLNNLSTHAVMAQILDEIEYVGDAIREIHIELQNDRLAMAESSRDKLKQARLIQDAKLREVALLSVVNSATDAKRILMRNYICVLADLYNWEIIGCSAGEHKTAELVKAAFRSVEGSLEEIRSFHTDRGNEFKNRTIEELLETFHIERSLSHKGCLYDNAVAEATFKIIKTEFVWNEIFVDLTELKLKLWDYVHWYNHHRIHSSLGYQTPIQYRQNSLKKVV